MVVVRIFHKASAAMFFGFGAQFGVLSFKEWNSDCSGYIYSRLNYRFLINLSITSMVASRALKFIRFFSSRKLKFLYLLDEGFMNLQPRLALNSRRFWKLNFYIVNYWISGTLTNYKVVRGKLIKFKSRTNFTSYANGFIFLDGLRYLNGASAEARSSKLPSVGLVDVDGGFSPFLYSIPSNNKMFSIFFFYYKMFVKASESGWFTWNAVCGNFADCQAKRVLARFLYFSKFNFLDRFVGATDKLGDKKGDKLSKFNFIEPLEKGKGKRMGFGRPRRSEDLFFMKIAGIRFDLFSFINYMPHGSVPIQSFMGRRIKGVGRGSLV